MPFGYLEFSRAIGREPCKHMRARRRWRRPAGRRRCRARARVRVRVRVPYPAWFFLNQVSRVWVASIPAPLSEPNPLRYPDPNRPANGCLKTVAAVGRLRRLNRTVATVQIELLDGFGPNCPSRSAINSAPFSHSERGLRKFNRFFNRIVV